MNGKIRKICIGILGICLWVLGWVLNSYSYQVTVQDLPPSFKWTRGCVPTAAADIFGYWDTHGYPNLLNEIGDIMLTDSVRPDIDLIANSMNTLPSGGTYIGNIMPGITKFTQSRGYKFDTDIDWNYTWEDLVNQVDSGKISMGIVDVYGKGQYDHAIPVFGYDQRDDGSRYYAFYNTWVEQEQVEWRNWHGMMVGDGWGVAMMITIDPVGLWVPPEPEPTPEPKSIPGPTPVPEPKNLLLVGIGLIVISKIRRRKI